MVLHCLLSSTCSKCNVDVMQPAFVISLTVMTVHDCYIHPRCQGKCAYITTTCRQKYRNMLGKCGNQLIMNTHHSFLIACSSFSREFFSSGKYLLFMAILLAGLLNKEDIIILRNLLNSVEVAADRFTAWGRHISSWPLLRLVVFHLR